MAIKAVCLLL